jgi:DNA-binding NarL/FixJ family response regulator
MSPNIPSQTLPSGSGPGGLLRVAIGDEHAIAREGLAALLHLKEGVRVTGSTGDGRECVRLVLREEPDLLIFDNAMSGLKGVEAARRIGAQKPRTRLLCLSSRDDARSVRDAFDAGVHGYVAKRSGFAALLEAIDRVFRSGYYVSPDIAHVLVEGFRGRHGASAADVPVLTAREREVARLYAEGFSTRDIATRLNVSMKTVGTHREHVMEKIGARSIAHLTRYAIRAGLVLIDDETM